MLGEEVVIASSSSGLLGSRLREGCRFPGRVLVGHPFNPPHLIPLVEVVSGPGTDPKAVAAAMDFYRSVGKHPIEIRKEVPGHLANRLQAALWREAVHLVADGVASVADVDAAISEGPGLRWALMGPHATFHLAGGEGSAMGPLGESMVRRRRCGWRRMASISLTRAKAISASSRRRDSEATSWAPKQRWVRASVSGRLARRAELLAKRESRGRPCLPFHKCNRRDERRNRDSPAP